MFPTVKIEGKAKFQLEIGTKSTRVYIHVYSIFPPKLTDSLNPRHGTLGNVCSTDPRPRSSTPERGVLILQQLNSSWLTGGAKARFSQRPPGRRHWPSARTAGGFLEAKRPLTPPRPPTRASCSCRGARKGVTNTQDEPRVALEALSLRAISVCHTTKRSSEMRDQPKARETLVARRWRNSKQQRSAGG